MQRSFDRIMIAVTGLTALIVSGSASLADEALKYKLVAHNTGYVAMDPGDAVDGHLVGDAKFVGIMMLEDGRLGSVTYIARYDYTKGSGPFSSYQTVRFDDGSLLRFRNNGDAVSASGRTTFSNCRIEVLGGEGRYKGATGGSTFTGTRLVPFADGGDSFFEGTINVKSPQQ